MSKSRIMGLMARREAMKVMQAQTEVSRLVRRHADVQASVARLEEMARDTHSGQGRVLTAGALAAERLIGAEISQETLRQRDQLDSLSSAMQDARAVLAKQDYRQTWMEDAAKTARRDERSAREALVAAATPPRRRA
jgi:flagellar FliJ protein